MLTSDALTELSSTSGLTDQNRLLAILNLAGLEIWTGNDFPDTLEEQPFIVTQEIRVTFPWYVYCPRAVKGCDKIPVELNTPRPWYFDSKWFLTPWEWRHIKSTPLIQNINNATTITFSRPSIGNQQYENTDVNITITGSTDLGSKVTEVVLLARGQGSISTTNRFLDVIDVHKDVFCQTDISGATADGVVIIQLPNHLFEARNSLWQIRDDCYPYIYCCMNMCRCLLIAYKRIYEPFANPNDPIKDSLYLPLIWKAREISKINADADIPIFAAKYQQAMRDVSFNYSLGKQIKLNTPRNRFTKVYGGHL